MLSQELNDYMLISNLAQLEAIGSNWGLSFTFLFKPLQMQLHSVLVAVMAAWTEARHSLTKMLRTRTDQSLVPWSTMDVG